MKQIFTFILILSVFASCKTNIINMTVTEPAPVTMPSYVKKTGVINRSMASEETKDINKIDQVLSGEGKDLDKDGAKESMTRLTEELMNNKRFTEVKALNNVDLRTNGLGLFPPPLDWGTIDKICKENDVDAIFSLELFDTDTKISYSTVPVTIKTPLGAVPAVEHHATMVTTVKTGWRIYDPKNKRVVDEYSIDKSLTFTGKGINPIIAAAGLIGRKDAVNQASKEAGHIYAGRIIPYTIGVSRDYFVKGNDNFARAKRKAQTENWNEAAELWKKETTNIDNKLAGRACYNMALVCEINGDLETAIQWAKQAYENHNNHLALKYLDILENRKAKNNTLKQQEAN